MTRYRYPQVQQAWLTRHGNEILQYLPATRCGLAATITALLGAVRDQIWSVKAGKKTVYEERVK